MSDNNLEFVVKDTNSDMLGYLPKTPMQYAEAEENIVYAVINGGYFDMTLNVSASLLAENGRIKSKNSINEGVNHYPTVGAFGLNENNTFAAYYVYSFGSTL